MKELTTQTGIIVKCSKTAIEFFQNAQSVDFFSALEIPKEFQDIAVEFYDLILENDHPTALLGCRGNYDIAVQIDEVTAVSYTHLVTIPSTSAMMQRAKSAPCMCASLTLKPATRSRRKEENSNGMAKTGADGGLGKRRPDPG